MVVLAIGFGHLLALGAHVLLERRIDYQLLGDTVPGQLPGELVAEALLMVMVV